MRSIDPNLTPSISKVGRPLFTQYSNRKAELGTEVPNHPQLIVDTPLKVQGRLKGYDRPSEDASSIDSLRSVNCRPHHG